MLRFTTMFGDISGMMGKLKQAQEQIEATKERLNTVFVEENSDGIFVKISANREIKDIAISEKLLNDKEALEDYLVIVLNKAIEKASKINEAELAAAAKNGLPNIPGMDLFK